MRHAKAPAKINLFLDVLGRRADGYHNIHTAFCSVSLFDEVIIHPAGQRQDSATHPIRSFDVRGPFAEGTPNDERNLVWKAITAAISTMRQHHCKFWDQYYPRFDVELVKNIPHGAGLGGGSSDAASALMLFHDVVHDAAANAGYGELKLEQRELTRIATDLGSDVPYFLHGGFAEASGRGEVLAPLPARGFSVLIVKPSFTISTRDAYGALTPAMFGPRSNLPQLKQWLAGETLHLPDVYNSFEMALDAMHADLPIIRGKLVHAGAQLALLSGSGSATFGIFADDESRDRAGEMLCADYPCFSCTTIV